MKLCPKLVDGWLCELPEGHAGACDELARTNATLKKKLDAYKEADAHRRRQR